MPLKNRNGQSGFTIMELIMVIVIIAILATVVLVAYNGVQRRATVSSVISELQQANTQLGTYGVDNGDTFPDELASLNNNQGLKFQDGFDILYTAYNEEQPADFCISAVRGDVIYNVTRFTEPTEGYCSDHVPLGTPATPTIGTAVDSTSQITVSWEAVDDADSYSLEYSTSATFSPLSETNGISGLSQAVTGLQSGTEYFFRLYAVNEAGPGGASNIATDTTLTPSAPGAPVLTLVVNSPTQITANWGAIAGASSYRLEYSKASTFTSPTSVPGIAGTTRANTGLSPGTRYYFRAYAVNSGVDSAVSSSVNAITTISAPDSPTVAAAIPGSTRSASSGPWAKSYDGDPTSGNWYYASGAVSSSTCASGTTRQQRARVQYNSPTTWGAWTGWTTSSTFYAVQPLSGYGIRFQVQTRCYTSSYTSTGSTSGYGCRWRSGSTTCTGF